MLIAVIGGTGLTQMDGLVVHESKRVNTKYGEPSSEIKCGELGGSKVMFLARHGAEHTIPPHKINYCANIAALKALGATHIVGVNAVGGIREDMVAEHITLPNDLIDYSYGRKHTFFEDEGDPVTHVDLTAPYDAALRERLIAGANEAGISITTDTVYGCTQGPRLETAAEIIRLERDGCDVVGMTGMPEAGLARELEMAYACVSLIVNKGAGKSDGIITMAEIEAALVNGMQSVLRLLSGALRQS
jgi:5'-methylthioinosine phosphorylase